MIRSWRKRLSSEGNPIARKRTKVLSTEALFSVAETTSFDLGQHFSSWRRAGIDTDEATERDILTLLEVCRELKARHR